MPLGEENLERWLGVLWARGGTDLVLTAGAPPFLRVDGAMARLEGEPELSSGDVEEAVRLLVGDKLAERYHAGHDIDFSFSWHEAGRFRGNAYRQRRSCALALRFVPLRIPSFAELGLPPVVEELLRVPHGLILVTGPTGSGKSTTLASMIDWLNERRAGHILTIEDPIEYVHAHKGCVVSQREVGSDADAFDSALRSALREDPDILLVGEMRDPESIQTALTIAETGHLVLATLHTNDTAQALDRIIDVFPADRRPLIQVQLAATLAGVIYQRLLPRPEGGLIAAFELMLADHAVRNLIREGKTRQLRNVVSTSGADGMQTLEMSLTDLVARGAITLEAAEAVSLHPADITRLLEVRARPLTGTDHSRKRSARRLSHKA